MMSHNNNFVGYDAENNEVICIFNAYLEGQKNLASGDNSAYVRLDRE